MAYKIVKTRKGKLVRIQTPSYGVVDGVAGAYTSPNYIPVQNLNFTPGTDQYRRAINERLSRITEAYKKEVSYA